MKKLHIIFYLFIPMAVNSAQWYTAKQESIDIYRQLNGEIEAVNKATVSAQTAGRVSKLNYDVDDIVTKGSVIVEFTNSEQKSRLQQANANAQAAKVAFEQAQIDYKRTKEILQKKLIAKSELDQALSNSNALEAKYKAAQAAVATATKQFEYTIIRAPYDGIVTERFVELGETVNPGTKIMEGLSLDKLRVVTYVPEKIINQVKSNPQAVVKVGNDKIHASTITIFPYADKMSRTFKTRIEINSSEVKLFPGMTVKVAFKVGQIDHIVIPNSAIIHRSELTMVKVKHNNSSILRQVKLGTEHEDGMTIISGLNVGEQVLLNPLSDNTLDHTIESTSAHSTDKE